MFEATDNESPIEHATLNCHEEDVDDPEPGSNEAILASVVQELQELRSSTREQQIYRETSDAISVSKKQPVTLLDLIRDDSECNAFLGIRESLLDALTKCVHTYEKKNDLHCCSLKARIAMTLCKLRLNLTFICLSVLFQLHVRTCSRYFYHTLVSLAAVLRGGIQWPTKEETLNFMPTCFSDYKQTRVILDCTETPIEKPKCLHCRLLVYSHYKGRETIKFLIGISPAGLITYVSPAFGGRASDKAIFNYSNILDKVEPGIDAIMVDKGFMIDNECASAMIQLIRPPFQGKRKQFTETEAKETKKIAAARIHVERVIQRIKQFQILNGPVPWRTGRHMGMISNIICAIVNLSPPILSAQRFDSSGSSV